MQGICELAEDVGDTTTGTGITTADSENIASNTSMNSWTSTEDGSTTAAQLPTTSDSNTSTTTFGDDSTTGSASEDGESTVACDDEGCTTTTGVETDTLSESSESGEPLPSAVELISNHGFESSELGWARFGQPEDPVAFARSTADAHEGSACGLVTGRAQHWNGVSANVTAKVHEGVPYMVSAWLKLADDTMPEGKVMQLSRKLDCVEAAAPSYGVLGSTAIALVTPDAWIQVTGTLLVPEGCNAREVLLYFEDPSTSSAPFPDFYVDEVYATPDTL